MPQYTVAQAFVPVLQLLFVAESLRKTPLDSVFGHSATSVDVLAKSNTGRNACATFGRIHYDARQHGFTSV